MKLLILSDSHGDVTSMVDVVEKEQPDTIIHLGDLVSDAMELRNQFPHIAFLSVPGNCDGYMPVEDCEKMVEISGKKFFLCHGHTRQVKLSYLQLLYKAKEEGADVALFGHTHIPYQEEADGLILFNPGSIGSPHYGSEPTYGVIEIDDETKEIYTELCEYSYV
ncbi:hypothetical protein SAMN04487761_10929 [Lachnospiraceae bacterium C7]|nr:hypothetical protein SAMN04487761_10929 [Lachnospiraceae bacterium C7]